MDESKKGLKLAAFDPNDMERGEDGELYHLPTLRALHAAGRLSHESAGYLILMQRAALHSTRLIA
ncbi:hypothetical protein DAETH_08500 [Deinococcus aetherius]|uniref:Uncharacterized protein n=1 Tax=Deinococcus aetherius TaxID=200252 RepID=A0ABN6RF87_9DEIO|nr:hypothetical protein [Deinococcus aetherius]BDP40881.1 hypothetical protein DAETH_08500 [Deinococcus aetherius]